MSETGKTAGSPLHVCPILICFLLAGCGGGPEPQAAPAPLGVGIFMYDEQARAVLQSMNIEREPVSVEFRPMSLNRLVVEVPSLDSGIPNLLLTLVDLGRGWELERPARKEVSAWLERSRR